MPAEIRRFGYPALAAVPMVGALVGGWFDQSLRLGFTTWRSACRASGLDLSSLFHFTLQLLPFACIGLLAGGVLVLVSACFTRDADHARGCLAAHAGCAITLPVALLLCASTMPLLAMLVIELALTALAVVSLRKYLDDRRASLPSVVLRTRTSRGA